MKRAQALAPQGWVGLGLVGIFWPLNWTLPGLRTAYLFLPLWLGYILVVDALVLGRTGTSLWSRSRRGFCLLFVISAPAWWLFEVFNRRTGNWQYLGDRHFSDTEYMLLASISFSTVMPAVFETAELVRSFRWLQHFGNRARLRAGAGLDAGLLLTGLLMLAFVLLWPRHCYPFLWTALVFILEPVNGWLRRPRLLPRLREGDWRPVISLALGALICGFFWEMWNYYSYPKWVYHTPGAQFLHIFEMPLLGYAGYIPFALELYELKSLVWPGKPELKL